VIGQLPFASDFTVKNVNVTINASRTSTDATGCLGNGLEPLVWLKLLLLACQVVVVLVNADVTVDQPRYSKRQSAPVHQTAESLWGY